MGSIMSLKFEAILLQTSKQTISLLAMSSAVKSEAGRMTVHVKQGFLHHSKAFDNIRFHQM